jgi:hypothetical protein
MANFFCVLCCSVDKVLTYMACPYFARKILKHASKFVKDIVVCVRVCLMYMGLCVM